MRKKIITIFITIILFSQISYGQNLNLSGTSYLLMDEVSGRVILERNGYMEMAMASTTKIMTALLALENSGLDDIVKIDERSVGVEGSSIYLKNNEEITMKDLLYGLMLRSGNDSAVAIANHICDTEEDFIQLMNKRARQLNALNTNFENPHGLTEDNHYSTAYDLALITREAFKYDIFADIVGSKSYNADRAENGYFLNKNKTLWEYEGGDGVKIGYTMAAGRCLVSSALRDDMRLIAVSLNAPNWFNDNYQLKNYGFENFVLYTIYDQHQLMRKIQLTDDLIDINVVTESEFVYPLREEELKKIKINISIDKDLELPIEKGHVIGTIETYLNGVSINKDNLISANKANKMSLLDRLLKSIYN